MAAARLRELDLRFHLFGDAELPERLREADAGRRAARRIRIRNGRGREQRALNASGVEISGLRAPVRTATPTATLARNVSLLSRRARMPGLRETALYDRHIEWFAFVTCRFVRGPTERGLHLVPADFFEARNQLLDRGLDAAWRDERDLVRVCALTTAEQKNDRGSREECLHQARPAIRAFPCEP